MRIEKQLGPNKAGAVCDRKGNSGRNRIAIIWPEPDFRSHTEQEQSPDKQREVTTKIEKTFYVWHQRIYILEDATLTEIFYKSQARRDSRQIVQMSHYCRNESLY